jgi:hypothetical protein
MIGENRTQFILVRMGIQLQIYVIGKSSHRLCAENHLDLWHSIRETLRLR